MPAAGARIASRSPTSTSERPPDEVGAARADVVAGEGDEQRADERGDVEDADQRAGPGLAPAVLDERIGEPCADAVVRRSRRQANMIARRQAAAERHGRRGRALRRSPAGGRRAPPGATRARRRRRPARSRTGCRASRPARRPAARPARRCRAGADLDPEREQARREQRAVGERDLHDHGREHVADRDADADRQRSGAITPARSGRRRPARCRRADREAARASSRASRRRARPAARPPARTGPCRAAGSSRAGPVTVCETPRSLSIASTSGPIAMICGPQRERREHDPGQHQPGSARRRGHRSMMRDRDAAIRGRYRRWRMRTGLVLRR